MAVSGGVDSAVAALLLRQQGYQVHGLFIKMTGSSREMAALNSAENLSKSLEMPLHSVDTKDTFQKEVIEYFFRTYESGLTPNPCVICNPSVKLKAAINTANRLGINRIATGHYARVRCTGRGKHFLLKALDEKKDQSYFLHRVGPKVLERLLLPLGGLTRQAVEKMAKERGLEGMVQKESQDICFLAGDYKLHLERYTENRDRPGPISTTDGRLVGRHLGLSRYTIGQRRGLGIPDKTPYYVVRIDPSSNTLIIGKKEELFQAECQVCDLHWFVDASKIISSTVSVKLRSRHKPVRARIKPVSNADGRVIVYFREPQRAITPGQFAVFYRKSLVLGGGVICR